MRTKEETSIQLLLASIVTMFGVMLILVTVAMSWELWMVPVILIGNTMVWCLHIGRAGSATFYENLCAGLLMVGFFFFSVHKATLFEMPAVACMLILVFSMFNKKRLLYMTASLYVLVLLYHFFLLRTITYDMGAQELVRLGLGGTVVLGALIIAVYRINRRREIRKQYDSTLVLLEESGKQNAEFLSNVSHELRTPINMVLGISDVILEKEICPELRSDLESIKMAGKRLSNQINNMLDYTEIVEGTLIPAREPYMITSLLNDIITMTAMQGGKHDLEMVFDLDPMMPAVLVGDVEKISHVMKILLDNSIKFTENGGINVCVNVRQESYGVNLIIDVCDTGIGMTNSQLTQMCDDFYQADSGSGRFAGGLGLGLPIARGLLHAMGGFIHFDSKEQEGLRTRITIPQGVKDDSPALTISHPERLCIACYFRPERYNSEEVRGYYDNMILHMVEGLGIEGYQVHNFEGLQKVLDNHSVTHLFIAQSEYEENSFYYEELGCTLPVVVIAERDFLMSRDSRLMVIRKPFFALSVVNLLNGMIGENEFKEAQAAGRKPFSCESVHVLAVDDEEMNLVVAKGVLGSYGIQVDTCLSGKEAVERCACTQYDIVFLDHMMPGFDGVETLKRIRELNNGMYKELPIIALTANTISGAREMFRHEGFTEFIPKPIERAVLERVLRRVLPDESVQYAETPEKEVWSEKESDSQKERAQDGRGSEAARKGADSPGAAAIPNRPSILRRKRKKKKNNLNSDNISPNEAVLAQDEPEKEVLEKDGPGKAVPNIDEIIPEEAAPKNPSEEDIAGETVSAELSPDKAEKICEINETDETDVADKTDETDEADEVYETDEAGEAYETGETDETDEADETDETDEDQIDEIEDEYEYDESAVGNRPAFSFVPLARIGVNIQLGLDYCCGEDDFYLEMLQMFYSQAEEKKMELESLYESANVEDYTVKVHALKSTSMTIGAETLAEQARLLEQAGKKKNMEYIRHGHPILLRLYDEVCEAIARL